MKIWTKRARPWFRHFGSADANAVIKRPLPESAFNNNPSGLWTKLFVVHNIAHNVHNIVTLFVIHNVVHKSKLWSFVVYDFLKSQKVF